MKLFPVEKKPKVKPQSVNLIKDYDVNIDKLNGIHSVFFTYPRSANKFQRQW